MLLRVPSVLRTHTAVKTLELIVEVIGGVHIVVGIHHHVHIERFSTVRHCFCRINLLLLMETTIYLVSCYYATINTVNRNSNANMLQVRSCLKRNYDNDFDIIIIS